MFIWRRIIWHILYLLTPSTHAVSRILYFSKFQFASNIYEYILAILNFSNVRHYTSHYRLFIIYRFSVSNHFQFSWIMRKVDGSKSRWSMNRLIGYRLSNKVFITGRDYIDQKLLSDGSITTNWFCIDQSIQSPIVSTNGAIETGDERSFAFNVNWDQRYETNQTLHKVESASHARQISTVCTVCCRTSAVTNTAIITCDLLSWIFCTDIVRPSQKPTQTWPLLRYDAIRGYTVEY